MKDMLSVMRIGVDVIIQRSIHKGNGVVEVTNKRIVIPYLFSQVEVYVKVKGHSDMLGRNDTINYELKGSQKVKIKIKVKV